MPFTPLHMGPGLLLKQIFRRHFSLTMFGITQVAIDIEPLVRMYRGDSVIHAHLHSYLGSTLVAVVVLVSARPLCTVILRRWNQETSFHKVEWLSASLPITWTSAIIGTFIGAWSHVFLDSLMHYDLRPLLPFSKTQPLLNLLGNTQPGLYCLIAGLLGFSAWLISAWKTKCRIPGA